MFLIWGWRAVSKTLSEGVFFCPNDGADRPYRLRSARRFFTLFWIPIIPLKQLGEYVECQSCKSTFEPRVLTLPTTAQIEDKLTTALRHLIVSILRADGMVEASERAAALDVMREFSSQEYGEAELDRDLDTLATRDVLEHLQAAAGVLNEHGKESVLTACVTLASSDGSVDPSELELAERAGAALGMSPAHVRGVIQAAVDAVGP